MFCPTGKTSLAPQLPTHPSALAAVAPLRSPAATAAIISARSLLMTNPPNVLVGKLAHCYSGETVDGPSLRAAPDDPQGHDLGRRGDAARASQNCGEAG